MNYQIEIEIETESSPKKTKSFVGDTKTLHELIGRYTLKYGTPFETLSRRDGSRVFNFYEKTKFGFKDATLTFREVKTNNVTVPQIGQVITPEHERIKALLDAGVITRGA